MKHPSESLIIPEHKKEMTPREERAARREEKKREGEAAEAQARAEARAEREQREEQRKADAAARSAAREQKGRTISNEELASQLAKAAMAKMGGAMGGKTTREVLAGGTKPSAPPPVAIAETKKSEPAQPKIKPAKEGEVAEIGQMRMSGGDINVKTEGPGEERAQKARKAERKEAGVAVLSPTQEVEKRLDSVAQSLGADSYESLYKRQKMEALNMVRDQIRNDITATQTQIRREPQNKAALEDDIARNRKLLDALSKISA